MPLENYQIKSLPEPWCTTATWFTREADTETDWSQYYEYDWTEIAVWKNSQYAVYNEGYVNQPEARRECQQCGAQLLSVANHYEHSFIVKHM